MHCESASVNATGIEAPAETAEVKSPETYLGYSRAANFTSPGGAMRDIAADEELTLDYCLFDSLPGRMTCRCGTTHCRGVITGDDWRRPELQVRYAGWFSRYLADRMEGRPR